MFKKEEKKILKYFFLFDFLYLKVMHGRPDMYGIPIQRSYSTTSNQSNLSTSSSTSSSPPSSGHSVPLKKRLLHAYKNEQRPSSSL